MIFVQPSSNMSSPDLSFLREFCRDDRRRMAQYIRTFLESVPEVLTDIDKSLKEKNADSLRKAVHSLKPQVTFLGLNGLKEKAEQIEDALASAQIGELTIPMIVELRSGLEEASEELVETLLTLS
ncbi:MAG: Hpt domain-containing protein [Chitinophagales bacterium]